MPAKVRADCNFTLKEAKSSMNYYRGANFCPELLQLERRYVIFLNP